MNVIKSTNKNYCILKFIFAFFFGTALGQSSWSTTDERSEENLQLLRSVLEEPIGEGSSRAEQKAQLLYRSCMDSGGLVEARGAGPLRRIVEEVGGWNLTRREDQGEDKARDKVVKVLRWC